MNNKHIIERYLIEEKKLTGAQLIMALKKIEKYEDICKEFCLWLEKRDYEFDNPLEVGGYTAKQIFELNPRLNGIGVYNFLITLREEPEVAKKYIEEGFREG